jgi:hypothetical protein
LKNHRGGQISAVVKTFLLAAAILASTAASADACRLFSVDKSSYVAKNERIFRIVPLPARAHRVTSYSIGQTASNACLPGENGPPYSSFTTWHVYSLPGQLRPAAIIRFYERELPSGWWLQAGDAASGEGMFRHGTALIYVSSSRRELMISIDHDTTG